MEHEKINLTDEERLSVRALLAKNALQGAVARFQGFSATDGPPPANFVESLTQTVKGMMHPESPEYMPLLNHCLDMLKAGEVVVAEFEMGAGYAFTHEEDAIDFAEAVQEFIAGQMQSAAEKGTLEKATAPPCVFVDKYTTAGGIIPMLIPITRKRLPIGGQWVEEVPPLHEQGL